VVPEAVLLRLLGGAVQQHAAVGAGADAVALLERPLRLLAQEQGARRHEREPPRFEEAEDARALLWRLRARAGEERTAPARFQMNRCCSAHAERSSPLSVAPPSLRQGEAPKRTKHRKADEFVGVARDAIGSVGDDLGLQGSIGGLSFALQRFAAHRVARPPRRRAVRRSIFAEFMLQSTKSTRRVAMGRRDSRP
jgi:hypothetical protein